MSDTPDLIFEEPPTRAHGGGGTYSPIRLWLNALRDHPGQWAKYPETVHASTRTFISQGTSYGVSEGEFEVCGRMDKSDPGKVRIHLYARFIGGES